MPPDRRPIQRFEKAEVRRQAGEQIITEAPVLAQGRQLHALDTMPAKEDGPPDKATEDGREVPASASGTPPMHALYAHKKRLSGHERLWNPTQQNQTVQNAKHDAMHTAGAGAQAV